MIPAHTNRPLADSSATSRDAGALNVRSPGARGFVKFPVLAALVFVLSLSVFVWMRFAGETETNPVHAAVSKVGAAISEIVIDDGSQSTQSRPSAAEGPREERPNFAARFADLFDKSDERPAMPLPSEMSPEALAEHSEWVETFQAQLYSPELPAAEPAEEEAVPVISGRVLTQHGMPVEGIEVTAVFRDYFKTADSIARRNAVGTQVTTTNSDGFYAFRGLPEGIYLVGTKDSGHYAATRSEVRTGVKYADLRLKTQRKTLVRGIVTDPMGNEISGAQIMPLVKGVPAGTTSDVYGEFQLAVALQAGVDSFPLRVRRNGFREQRYQVKQSDRADDGSLSIVVEIEPVHEFSTVSGRVTDTAGMPVAGETVRLYSPRLQRHYRTKADSGGEFEFNKVEISDDYHLWMRPTGSYRDFAKQNVALDHGNLRHDIELELLERDYRLSGRILDRGGRPVPNLTLTLRSRAASSQALPLTSNAYGKFEIENIPGGELVLESRTTPYYILSGVHLSGDEKDHEVDLVVNRGPHKLLGKVVDSDGRPVTSPRILISSAQVINGISTRLSSSTSADADGRFLFTDLGDGQHTVTVNAPGYKGMRLQPVVGNQNELVIRLEKNST